MTDPIEVQSVADRMVDAVNEVWPLQCPMCPNRGDVAAAVVGAYMDENGWPIHLQGQVPPWMERLEHATETFIASDGAPAIRLVPGPVYRLPDRGSEQREEQK